MNLAELEGQHGVNLAAVMPIVDKTEGMDEIQFEARGARFAYDSKNMQVKLELPVTKLSYNVDGAGYSKAMRLVGFPEAVVKKYPTEIMIAPLNWAFPEKMKGVKAFVKDHKLVAFVKPTLELVSTRQMLETVDSVVKDVTGEPPLFERLDHDLNHTNCSIIINRHRAWTDERLKAKDTVLAGVNFQNSLMGEFPLTVSVYAYRLVCSNGLISAEQTYKWSRKTHSMPTMEWFKEHMTAAAEAADAELDKLGALRDVSVPEAHRAEIMQNVFAEFGISERIRRVILEYLVNEPARNMYDIVQAITRAANDADLQDNPLTIRRLQSIGGQMLSRVNICPSCYSVKAA